MQSLKEFSEKANREFAQNEETQEELRKRFYTGFHCRVICDDRCKYAKLVERFHPITGNKYKKYICTQNITCNCDSDERHKL